MEKKKIGFARALDPERKEKQNQWVCVWQCMRHEIGKEKRKIFKMFDNFLK